jgi:D-alanine-D-alanine ligase
MKIRIGIVFGGRSGEHEISVRSAQTVIEQIDKSRFAVVPLAITTEGKWLNPSESGKLLPEPVRKMITASGTGVQAERDLDEIAVSGLTTQGGPGAGRLNGLDVVFPVLHGTYGEDGTIQGLFEMGGIPYVGCGVLASSCGMDKVVMKTLFRDAGLPMCKYVWFLRREWEQHPDSIVERIGETLGYPCFAKPANLGSSVGVSRADDAESLIRAIDEAAKFDRKIIVEEGLEMREIECAVIGNDDPEASLPGEYLIRDESKKFLDYTEKYSGTGNNEFVTPAPIPETLADRIKADAVTAFKAIDGSGLARVDFFLLNDGTLLINEINTLPGLTNASGFPKMWAASGREFSQVIDKLVELAMERHEDRSRNRTSHDS